MGKYTGTYFECVKKDGSLTVLEECIHSLNISIKFSQASDTEKENMLSILDLMLTHHNKIIACVNKDIHCSK